MRVYSECGRGVEISDIPVDLSVVKRIIAMAPKYAAEVESLTSGLSEEQKSDTEYFFNAICEFGESYPIEEVLVNVIKEVEGIELDYQDDAEGFRYLYFPASFPWNLSEKEKSLTEEDVDNIFRKYISMLADAPVEIRDLTICMD